VVRECVAVCKISVQGKGNVRCVLIGRAISGRWNGVAARTYNA
jgi:hypothetical protein